MFRRLVADNAISIIAMVIIGAVLGAVYSYLQPESYSATSRMFVVVDPSPSRYDLLPATWVASARVRDYTSMINSQNLLARAIDVHGLKTNSSLLSRNLEISSPNRTQLLDITVTLRDPKLAADASTAIAQEFATALRELETGVVIHASVVHLADKPQHAQNPRVLDSVVFTAMAMGVMTLVLLLIPAMRNPRLRWMGMGEFDVIAHAPVIGCIELSTTKSGKRDKGEPTLSAVSHCTVPFGVREHFAIARHRRPAVECIDLIGAGRAPESLIVAALERDLGARVRSTAATDATAHTESDADTVPASADPTIVVIDEAARWLAAEATVERITAETGRPVLVVILRRVRSAMSGDRAADESSSATVVVGGRAADAGAATGTTTNGWT